MTAVVFRDAAGTIVLHESVGPIGPTILDLAPYIISDLAGYTVQQLGEVPCSVLLRDSGAELVIYVGMPSFSGIYGVLTGYTYADLGALTYADLDEL